MTESLNIPKNETATAEAELLVFVLDGSGSMMEQKTFDNKPKVEHLLEIMRNLLDRLSRSSKKPAFRVSFIAFSQTAIIQEHQGNAYYSLDDAIKILANPVVIAGGRNTAIADAINKVTEVLNQFNKDEGIPSQKHATIFLLTDGQENVRSRDDVILEAKTITSSALAPTLATISFGVDADENLLMEIASSPNERQIRHLDMAQVLNHLPNDKKLFIQGHANGNISQEKAEALRSFVETLSQTAQILKQAKPASISP